MVFNYPVIVLAGAVLLMDVREDFSSSGQAPFLSGNGSTSLTFMYTVAQGDRSQDLSTQDHGDTGAGGGLIGTVLRDSGLPSQVLGQG